MPTMKAPPAFLNKLKRELTKALKANGIAARVSFEPVPTTKLYRVWVLAPKFKAMRPSERQDLVWRIAERALDQDEELRISMILTLADDEANSTL